MNSIHKEEIKNHANILTLVYFERMIEDNIPLSTVTDSITSTSVPTTISELRRLVLESHAEDVYNACKFTKEPFVEDARRSIRYKVMSSMYACSYNHYSNLVEKTFKYCDNVTPDLVVEWDIDAMLDVPDLIVSVPGLLALLRTYVAVSKRKMYRGVYNVPEGDDGLNLRSLRKRIMESMEEVSTTPYATEGLEYNCSLVLPKSYIDTIRTKTCDLLWYTELPHKFREMARIAGYKEVRQPTPPVSISDIDSLDPRLMIALGKLKIVTGRKLSDIPPSEQKERVMKFLCEEGCTVEVADSLTCGYIVS